MRRLLVGASVVALLVVAALTEPPASSFAPRVLAASEGCDGFNVVFTRDDQRDGARVYGPILRSEFRPNRDGGFALFITHTRGTELLAVSRGAGWEIVLPQTPLRGLWDLTILPYQGPSGTFGTEVKR